MWVIHFVRQVALVAIAAFAATSAGVIASSLVPFLLLQMPPWHLLSVSKPLLVFSLTCVMLFGVPIFLIASSQRRAALGIGSYVGYSTAVAFVVIMPFELVRIYSWAKFYDAIWILLTETIPGGIVGGMVAYMVMNITPQQTPDWPANPVASGRKGSAVDRR